jgi:uncharacterized protein YjhX (UPF0386 family)
MRGPELAEKLGVTLQAVHALVVKLYAQGHVRLGDPEHILEVVARVRDKTVLLSRDEARVLSAVPDAYATTIQRIRIAKKLPEDTVQHVLDRLLVRRFITKQHGLSGEPVYRVSSTGLKHPQRKQDVQLADAPRLSVESDRIYSVLSSIRDAQSLRTRDLKDSLDIPFATINALMQYLKRKELVQKTRAEHTAPYSLTKMGLESLREMERRRAA